MNYYIDTEFLEGTQKEKFPVNLFRRNTANTIDLISIGIVAEDGREFYAVSKDFNLKEAWNRFDLKLHSGDRRNQGDGTYKDYWIREKVLKPIYYEWMGKDINFHDIDRDFTYRNFKRLLKKYGETSEQITVGILHFTHGVYKKGINNIGTHLVKDDSPKFYAYFADYDWVVFCWLFGKMIDLPKGFPMYCVDLKQSLDEKEDSFRIKGSEGYMDLKKHTHYPKQVNSHNALQDARWNKKLYEFINSLK